ncbi:hypothetical protein [Nonomuraea fuscirosea]|uniref:hypothetical protein n=1 Tax=Nonomuraea fuscirosea TaxID=1291556 RepID=UPI0033F8C1CE
MRRTAIVPVLALTLLLVAGCGPAERPYQPGEGAAPPSAPASVSATGAPEGTPEPAASGTPEVGTVSIGGGKLKVTIDWPAKRDPLIQLMADYHLATRKAIVSGSDRYLQDLDLELTGAREAYDWVTQYTEQDKSMKGTSRLYNLRVAVKLDKGAQVNACVDDRGARVIHTRTGKAVVPQPDWIRRPHLHAILVHRGDDGVWRIRTFRYSYKGCPV